MSVIVCCRNTGISVRVPVGSVLDDSHARLLRQPLAGERGVRLSEVQRINVNHYPQPQGSRVFVEPSFPPPEEVWEEQTRLFKKSLLVRERFAPRNGALPAQAARSMASLEFRNLLSSAYDITQFVTHAQRDNAELVERQAAGGVLSAEEQAMLDEQRGLEAELARIKRLDVPRMAALLYHVGFREVTVNEDLFWDAGGGRWILSAPMSDKLKRAIDSYAEPEGIFKQQLQDHSPETLLMVGLYRTRSCDYLKEYHVLVRMRMIEAEERLQGYPTEADAQDISDEWSKWSQIHEYLKYQRERFRNVYYDLEEPVR